MTNKLIFKKIGFSSHDAQQIEEDLLTNHPIIYILYNQHSLQAYVGETVQFKRRLKKHLGNPQRKGLKQTILIGHKRFHQSATYNIETNLINYLIAENRYRLQNVSQTVKSEVHNYYRKHYYNEGVFTEIWEKLRDEEIVKEPIEKLKNRDTYKLSPFKELSDQQFEIKNQILNFCKKNIQKTESQVLIIEGEAGTGKSVLISSLFNTIQDYANDSDSILYGTNNYLLVNHSEMLKTYHSLAKSLPNIKKNKVMKPTTFINDQKITSANIVLVDEAHLLLTKEDRYNNFKGNNHLEEIIKKSKITIVIFDPKQVLRIKSYWNKKMLKEITEKYHSKTFRLEDQFRMNAKPEFVNWIDSFVSKKLINMPQVSQNTYDLQIFSNALEMKKAIEDKNKKFGLSRIVATFDYEHKKDGQVYYVETDGLKMPWNIPVSGTTWAEKEDTIHEVGSIYTIQGFDLNYVGVILGPSVGYDEHTGQILIDTTKYKDVGAFNSRSDLSVQEIQQAKQDIILNSINVLMKRGIHGLYIYATDPKLRKKLLSLVKR
ncbi:MULTISPECIES: DUF2075 domain-containing protein [Paenibacillus]|uniref:DUF2075 domain-containing protein n=1 Tax=Paenibacillus TaxID=44249 RepID=UPI00096C100F|nr:DUF2075 domain-containing protein [Paenibacillus peoriae]OMF80389.1 endonuclease [Paenibacillus peoriae]